MNIPNPKFSADSSVLFELEEGVTIEGTIWNIDYVFIDKTLNEPPHWAYYVIFPKRNMWISERFLYSIDTV